jgi:hypothetical protein
MIFKPGQIIKFSYQHSARDKESGPKDKEVFVLHPNWMGKVHGIDLKRLTKAEREVLAAIIEPPDEDGTHKPHRLPLVNDIRRRMQVSQEIKNPVTFYTKFVKPFLRGKDAYRQYFPTKMMHPAIVKGVDLSGNVVNPNPLFGKQTPPKPPAGPQGLTKPGTPDVPNPAKQVAADRRDAINAALNKLRNSGFGGSGRK